MTAIYPTPRDDAPLVVFDFDHTLYDGDSGSHLFAWLIKRNPLRLLAALIATPLRHEFFGARWKGKSAPVSKEPLRISRIMPYFKNTG